MTSDAPARSVLDLYAPATLAAVTAIHSPSETGGLSFVAGGAEHRFRLSLADLASLRDDVAEFIGTHLSRRVQAVGSEAGGGTLHTSASSTAASTAARSE